MSDNNYLDWLFADLDELIDCDFNDSEVEEE